MGFLEYDHPNIHDVPRQGEVQQRPPVVRKTARTSDSLYDSHEIEHPTQPGVLLWRQK